MTKPTQDIPPESKNLFAETPPQRKPWVGLDPEDFDGVIKSDAFEAGAYWANNKLKEKNT